MKAKKHTLVLLVTLLMLAVLGIPASAAGTAKISQTSLTIETGESHQLHVKVGDETVTAAWGSSDTVIATVDQTGKVTGKAAGSAVITATYDGASMECLVSVVKKSTKQTTRYNVLILDTSGSMAGTSLRREKEAARRFCKAVLESEGKNYLAIVTLNETSGVLCGFTDNLVLLKKKIGSVRASGGTNMNQALQAAGELLDQTPNGARIMKNVILCSDGLPRKGKTKATGRYKKQDYKFYQYANATYQTDVKIKKKKYFVYALGFFQNSKGNELKFGKRLMKDLASNDNYYIITNPKDIDVVFEEIVQKITSTTMNKKSVTLYVGQSYQLKALVDGAVKKASWKSSRSSVASVSSAGKVRAKKKGKATIRATVNGKTVSCTVTVKKKKTVVVDTSSIRLDQSSLTLYEGDTATIKATVTGDSQTVTWISGNSEIAEVKDGVVTAKKQGTAIIKATANGKTASCTVTVKQKPEPEVPQMEWSDPDSTVKKRSIYKMYDLGMNWEEAKQYCEAMGGHLAVITSSAEQKILEGFLAKGTKNCYWIGGYKNAGVWVWLTGEEFGFRNWASRQPDNFGPTGEDRLMMYRNRNPLSSGSGLGTWNDVYHDGTCNGEKFFGAENFGFICEIEIYE